MLDVCQDVLCRLLLLILRTRSRSYEMISLKVSYLSERELTWRADELSSSGEAFVKAIVDTLWLIDGHHDVFGERNLRIPACFSSFSGYNVPEMSKHRKRERTNMSASSLNVCAFALFGCLQGVYWEQGGWKSFKSNVETLALSLSKYTEYLSNHAM